MQLKIASSRRGNSHFSILADLFAIDQRDKNVPFPWSMSGVRFAFFAF
jgi:hypothetical protein